MLVMNYVAILFSSKNSYLLLNIARDLCWTVCEYIRQIKRKWYLTLDTNENFSVLFLSKFNNTLFFHQNIFILYNSKHSWFICYGSRRKKIFELILIILRDDGVDSCLLKSNIVLTAIWLCIDWYEFRNYSV